MKYLEFLQRNRWYQSGLCFVTDLLELMDVNVNFDCKGAEEKQSKMQYSSRTFINHLTNCINNINKTLLMLLMGPRMRNFNSRKEEKNPWYKKGSTINSLTFFLLWYASFTFNKTNCWLKLKCEKFPLILWTEQNKMLLKE